MNIRIFFGLKEDNLSQRDCQNQLCHPSLSHIEQDCQESGEFDSKKDSQSTEFERRSGMFVKLSIRELWNSKLFGLHAFEQHGHNSWSLK